MKSVRRDFFERVSEVLACLRHVEMLEGARLQRTIELQDGSRVPSSVAINATARKALRASIYLLTYNMIEAIATKSVQAIFDHFASSKTSFDDVRDEVKLFILTQAKKQAPSKLAPQLVQLSTDILQFAFDAESLFSGNIDARRLRKTAGQLGYSERTLGRNDHLKLIKDNRNDLAHGDKTFVEIGRDVSINDLRSHVASAIWYMRSVLNNVSEYLQKQQYLAKHATRVGAN